jgi:GntR family transcriptional regulator, sialic acid-inducible nan operon repressor
MSGLQDAPLRVRPIRRHRLWEDVAHRLEEMIQEGTFPPGTLLPPERELMRLFDVGRPSIREALFALHRMGLVRVSTGERASVTTPTPDTLIAHLSGAARAFLAQGNGVAHFHDARALFEAGIARRAAARATDDDIARLHRALEANEAARGDARKFEQADVAFHYVLAQITENPIFAAVHEALVDWLTSQRTIALRLPHTETVALDGHRRIFAAVAGHDPEAAGAAMEQHLHEIAALVRDATRGQA